VSRVLTRGRTDKHDETDSRLSQFRERTAHSVSVTKNNKLMPCRRTADCSEKRKETRLYFVGRKQRFVSKLVVQKETADFNGLSN
jgi:hypothetical protein